MYNIERQQEILRLLSQKGSMSVGEIALLLHFSEATVRRDLTALENAGRLRRTFGGAVLAETINRQVPLALREHENSAAKDEIAQKALQFIHDGDALFLDASSTVFALARLLPKFSDLTVITNSPKTSLWLGQNKIRSYCTGGLLLESSVAYAGPWAEEMVSRFQVNAMFFSCRGVTSDGILSDSSYEEASLRMAMMRASQKKVFLFDQSKLGKSYLYRLCAADQLDGVLSEGPLPF